MSKFSQKQGKLVVKPQYLKFPIAGTDNATKVPIYCILPLESSIPNNLSDNK